MKHFISVILTISVLTVFSSCQSQDNDQVADRARIEGKAQAEEQLKKDRELLEEQTENERGLQSEQIKKERDALDARAKSMEKSLSVLQDFYENNSGIYDGTMTRGTDKFSIRITLYPSIPRYNDSRIRTPAEIESDLTLLAFNAQILQWIPPSKDAVGCRMNGLKPNKKLSTLNIISPNCPSTYSLVLNRTSIKGIAQSENNPDPFGVYVERTSDAPAAAKKKPTKRKARK